MDWKERQIARKNKRAEKLNQKAADLSGMITNVSADGAPENINVVDKTENTPAETAEKARQTGEGRVKSFRENIAGALPDSAIRRRMLSKAEKKRDRLDAKFGKPDYSAPNNSISAKDQETFTKIGGGDDKLAEAIQNDPMLWEDDDDLSIDPLFK